MIKMKIKPLLVVVFVFVALFGFNSDINAAHTQSVLKSYKYDHNIFSGSVSNPFDLKYIYVADDARLYNTIDTTISSGWNYIRSEVVHYYKNADMNW